MRYRDMGIEIKGYWPPWMMVGIWLAGLALLTMIGNATAPAANELSPWYLILFAIGVIWAISLIPLAVWCYFQTVRLRKQDASLANEARLLVRDVGRTTPAPRNGQTPAHAESENRDL
ncbi:hypothetical protein GCM10011575_35800 [Microlunatus endophyticus]|uniref:Uncharacterized protein n=2 Tax=Microlunatus endophyticus TaxID=1716077 RepID=A0A917SF19_9ACTN|nr:hypothetical protein GCM10011575_35800 [Microlunatus endophyticus]